MIYQCDAASIFRVAYTGSNLPARLFDRHYELFLKLNLGGNFKKLVITNQPIKALEVAFEFCRGMKSLIDAGLAFYDELPRKRRF